VKIHFYKYHGAGNDFILLDNRKGEIRLSAADISWLCDRHLGVGADGLMLLETSSNYDFSMRYFNSDGNESTMCGNGGRCLTAFAHYLGLVDQKASFLAIDGAHEGIILAVESNHYRVKIRMKEVSAVQCLNDRYILDTGSPHLVLFKKGLEKLDIRAEGKKIRYSPEFMKEGINVDFVELKGEVVFVRTYERGVEDETLSCGTGVTATAIVLSDLFPGKNDFEINTLGGVLKVSFRSEAGVFTDIWLEGPAVRVFEGEYSVNSNQ